MLLHISVIHAAVKEGNKSLLALLLLLQFAEMKGAALSKIRKDKLYEMCLEGWDFVVVMLVVYLSWIVLYYLGTSDVISFNFSDMKLLVNFSAEFQDFLVSLSVVYLSEVCVDWIKHSSISINNDIMPRFYDKATAQVAVELSKAPNNSILTDRSFSVAKKMGLFPIPLAVVVLKLFFDCLSMNVFIVTCIALFLLKQITARLVQYFISTHKDLPVLNLQKIKHE